MKIHLDKKIIENLLERKKWNKSVPPSIQREFKSKQGYVQERIRLYFYQYEKIRQADIYNSLINAREYGVRSRIAKQ